MSKLTPQTLHQALGVLGELMLARDHPAQHFVVCGGSSLLALGLVDRSTTQDVDVLARVVAGKLITPRPLPEWLVDAADQVGRQLDLPTGWFNAQVAEDTLFNCGLPEGLQSRLTARSYGPRLTVGYISRRDQIFLKLHAAVDRDGGRHLQDLIKLSPTADELLDASRWTITQDSSSAFAFNLRSLVATLGHENITHQF